MNAETESSAQFMGEALLNHARGILRYARTFCQPTGANQAIGEEHRRKFSHAVLRMVNEMHALLLMARYKGVSGSCNVEQIEAYMEEARAAIDPRAIAAAAETAAGFSVPSYN